MSDNNVVVFPKTKINTAPQSLEEIRNSIDNARKEHVEILLDEFMSYITSRAYEEGFDFTLDSAHKSCFFILDSMRAGLYQTKELEHPLHRFIDRVVEDDRVKDIEKALDMLETSEDDGEEQS